MSRVFFISDLHLDHRNVIAFAAEHRPFRTIEEHNKWLIDNWNSKVHKNDTVYVLGDVSWTRAGLKMLLNAKGQKHLVMGNHDTFPIYDYLEVFRVIRPSPWPYKGHWLSHCPIHPDELRGKWNVHGHVHSNTIKDARYINVSVEAVAGTPMTLDELHELQERKIQQGEL